MRKRKLVFLIKLIFLIIFILQLRSGNSIFVSLLLKTLRQNTTIWNLYNQAY